MSGVKRTVVHVLGAGDLNVGLTQSERERGVELVDRFREALDRFSSSPPHEQLDQLDAEVDSRPAAIVGLLRHLHEEAVDDAHLVLVGTQQEPSHPGDTAELGHGLARLCADGHLSRWLPGAHLRVTVLTVELLSLQIVRDEVAALLTGSATDHGQVLVDMGSGSMIAFVGAVAGALDAGHEALILDTASVGAEHGIAQVTWDEPDEIDFLMSVRAYRTLTLRDLPRQRLWNELLGRLLLDWHLLGERQSDLAANRETVEQSLQERLDLRDPTAAFLGRTALESQFLHHFPDRGDGDYDALMQARLAARTEEEDRFRERHLTAHKRFAGADHGKEPTIKKIGTACAGMALGPDLRRHRLEAEGLGSRPTWRKDGVGIVAVGTRSASAISTMFDAALDHLEEQSPGRHRLILLHSEKTRRVAEELGQDGRWDCELVAVSDLYGVDAIDHIAHRVSAALESDRHDAVGHVVVFVGPGNKQLNVGALLAAGRWATSTARQCEIAALVADDGGSLVEPDERQVVFRIGNDPLLSRIIVSVAESERLGTLVATLGLGSARWEEPLQLARSLQRLLSATRPTDLATDVREICGVEPAHNELRRQLYVARLRYARDEYWKDRWGVIYEVGARIDGLRMVEQRERTPAENHLFRWRNRSPLGHWWNQFPPEPEEFDLAIDRLIDEADVDDGAIDLLAVKADLMTTIRRIADDFG
jgi:hypothetical protein